MTKLINTKHPIIGGSLSPDQLAVVDLLKEALAQALEGSITTVGIVACMKQGYATVLAGRQASDLFMGCASLQRKIIDTVEAAGEETVKRFAS